MKEGIFLHRNGEPGERHVVIRFNETWYRIPFMVLRDLKEKDLPAGFSTIIELPCGPIETNRIFEWITANTSQWTESSIAEIKALLQEINFPLEAFKVY